MGTDMILFIFMPLVHNKAAIKCLCSPKSTHVYLDIDVKIIVALFITII